MKNSPFFIDLAGQYAASHLNILVSGCTPWCCYWISFFAMCVSPAIDLAGEAYDLSPCQARWRYPGTPVCFEHPCRV
jgi:hypothetical protein